MCGIVGYVGHHDAWPIILTGLQRLEYRGYDSAGIAVLNSEGLLEVHKSVGKVRGLAPVQTAGFPHGNVGVGHTRWATHGKPSDANAHPHTDCRGQVAMVHNGIVENYLQIKEDLLSRGHRFTSETDSEVTAHLIEEGLAGGLSFEESFMAMSTRLQGSQAIVALRTDEAGKKLLAMRLGNAGGVVVAHRPGESMVSSDLAAMIPFAEQVSFLEDGEMAIVSDEGFKVVDAGGKVIKKPQQPVSQGADWVDKEGYKHFMLKEIMEQPRVATNLLAERVSFETGKVTLEDFPLSHEDIRSLNRVGAHRHGDQHARRNGGQAHDRRPGGHDRGGGQRLGVPLQELPRGREYPGGFRGTVGGNGRHPGGHGDGTGEGGPADHDL